MNDAILIIWDLFLLFIEVFFLNRIIIFFVVYIQSISRKKMWATIGTVIIDFVILWMYSFNYLYKEITTPGQNYSTSSLVTCVLRAAVVIGIFILTMGNIHGKIHIKSRRQKEYERALSGKEKSYLAPILISSIALIAGIAGLIYYKANYISDYKNDVRICIWIIILAAFSLISQIILMILRKKNPKAKSDTANVRNSYQTASTSSFKERDFVFIIEDDNDCYFYKGKAKGKIAFNELVGEIGDYYYISSYGTLKKGNMEYDLYGVKTSYLDHSMLTEIKLDKFESEEVKAVLPYLEKNHSKIFELDDSNHPINSFDA